MIADQLSRSSMPSSRSCRGPGRRRDGTVPGTPTSRIHALDLGQGDALVDDPRVEGLDDDVARAGALDAGGVELEPLHEHDVAGADVHLTRLSTRSTSGCRRDSGSGPQGGG